MGNITPKHPIEATTDVSEKNILTLERLGGEAVVGRWVEAFYDLVAQHSLLAPLFNNLPAAREKQYAYFIEIFGGSPLYTESYGRPFLRFKHRHFKIGQPERDAWMELVMVALKNQVDDVALQEDMEAWLGDLADKMINHHPEKQDAHFFKS